jgi:hypothetical protein
MPDPMIGQPRASPLPLIGGQARTHNAHCLLVELRILTSGLTSGLTTVYWWSSSAI